MIQKVKIMSVENTSEKKDILDKIAEKEWISRILIAIAIVMIIFAIYRAIFEQKMSGFKYCMVVVALVSISKGKNFIKDWGPFILVFGAYWSLRGVADDLNKNENSSMVIAWEEFLFGKIPTITLQAYRSSFMDYFCVVLYSLHYTIPIFTALLIYAKNKDKIFKQFTTTFSMSCLVFFAIFLAFPVAPPRLAEDISHDVEQIRFETLPNGEGLDKGFNANPYAAMPSLHSALPWLATLYLFKIRSKLAPIMLLVTIGIWFSTVYLGEHYIVDIIAGVLLASIISLIVDKKIGITETKEELKVA